MVTSLGVCNVLVVVLGTASGCGRGPRNVAFGKNNTPLRVHTRVFAVAVVFGFWRIVGGGGS